MSIIGIAFPGLVLSADGLVIRGTGLKIDETGMTGRISLPLINPSILKLVHFSILIGEPGLVTKNETEDAALLSGTAVKEGEGLMVVLAVGLNSQAGIIVELLRGKGN